MRIEVSFLVTCNECGCEFYAPVDIVDADNQNSPHNPVVCVQCRAILKMIVNASTTFTGEYLKEAQGDG